MRNIIPLILVMFIGCSSTIRHLRYNDTIKGYQFTAVKDSTSKMYKNNLSWRTLRDPISKVKIQDKNRAFTLIDSVNNKQLKLTDIVFIPKTTIQNQFTAGQKYFKGVNLFYQNKISDANLILYKISVGTRAM